jgi:hypothetical protein
MSGPLCQVEGANRWSASTRYLATAIGFRQMNRKANAVSIPMLKDHVALEVKVNDRTVTFRESEREGVTTASEQQGERISMSLSGYSPQNEEDTLPACRILIEAMNKARAAWAEPVDVDGPTVDCRACDSRWESGPLEIQVVRAIADEDFWRKLNMTGSVQIAPLLADFVHMIRRATEKKLNHYAEADKSQLVLALDANRLPAMAFHDVVDMVRSELRVWLYELGFREVLLVGPTGSLTHRLFP